MEEELENDLDFEAAVGLSRLSDAAMLRYSKYLEILREMGDGVTKEMLKHRDMLWREYLALAEESIVALNSALKK